MSNIDYSKIVTANDKAAETKRLLQGELARLRWEAETGGLELPDSTFVRTDRETRAALTEAVNALQAGLMQEPVPWKMNHGWEDLTQANLEAITAAVAAHVRDCFAAERTAQEQLETTGNLSSFDASAAFLAALDAAQTPPENQ